MEKVLQSTSNLERESLSFKLDLLFLEHPSYRGRDYEFLAEQINQRYIETVTAKEVFLVDEPCAADIERDYRMIYKLHHNE